MFDDGAGSARTVFPTGAKRPVTVVEQNADCTCARIGDNKVRYSVLIEIANGDGRGIAKGTCPGRIIDSGSKLFGLGYLLEPDAAKDDGN